MTASGKKHHGISIRIVHLAMILCAVIIAALLLVSTWQSGQVFSTLSTETANYIVRQKAAHDLMEASDYLTEMVQRFTLDGDTVYLNNYFDEAFVSKRREASILAMSENEADQALVQQLEESMEESQTLMYREYYAMQLIIDAYDIRTVPEAFPAIELKEEDIFLSPEEKAELAQRMVMGTEYYASKERIRTSLKTNLETLDQQMSLARQESSDRLMRLLSLVRIATIVMVIVLIFLIVLTSRLSTLPLIRAVERIRDRKKMPVTGAREFRQLAESYNTLYDAYRPKDTASGGNP